MNELDNVLLVEMFGIVFMLVALVILASAIV